MGAVESCHPPSFSDKLFPFFPSEGFVIRARESSVRASFSIRRLGPEACGNSCRLPLDTREAADDDVDSNASYQHEPHNSRLCCPAMRLMMMMLCRFAFRGPGLIRRWPINLTVCLLLMKSVPRAVGGFAFYLHLALALLGLGKWVQVRVQN